MLDKTFWATTRLVFLGLLIDMEFQLVLILKEKLLKGQHLIELIIEKKSKKATIKELQQLCGFLNFLGRAIVPGRAFTRRLYAYTKGALKPHHHVRITQEIRLDLEMWKNFLHHPSIFARLFLDFTKMAVVIPMYSDASKNPKLGFGATCETHWCYNQWNLDFMQQHDPSIEYLELYALVVAVVLWIDSYKNQRVVIHCDNMSVIQMINSTTSSCRNCMVLIRIFTLECLKKNVRVYENGSLAKTINFQMHCLGLDWINLLNIAGSKG